MTDQPPIPTNEADEFPPPVAPADFAAADPHLALAGAAVPRLTGGLAAVQYVLVPAAIGSRSALYGTDDTGRLWQKWWGYYGKPGDPGSAWECLGAPPEPGGLVGPLTAVYWVDHRYAIYGTTRSGQVYRRQWLTNQWTGWEKAGAPAPDHPVSGLTSFRLRLGEHIVVAAAGSGLYGTQVSGVNRGEFHWNTFDSPAANGRPGVLPEVPAGPVATACPGGDNYVLFLLGQSGAVWVLPTIGRPADWVSIGQPQLAAGRRVLALAAESYAMGRFAVYALDDAGHVHENYWDLQAFSGWHEVRFIGDDIPGYQPGTGLTVAFKYLGWYALYLTDAQGTCYQLWYEGTKWGSAWKQVSAG